MDGKKVAWETCQTFSGSWGYYRDELTWKSPAQIIAQLPKTVSLGGNLIMNVGPTGRGDFDDRALARLSDYAKWMDLNGRAIYGCTEAPSDFEPPDGTVLTWNPRTKRLYVHLLEWPIKSLPVKFWDRIAYAQFLHDGSEVLIGKPYWKRIDNGDDKSDLRGTFELPVAKPAIEVPVIEVFLKGRSSQHSYSPFSRLLRSPVPSDRTPSAPSWRPCMSAVSATGASSARRTSSRLRTGPSFPSRPAATSFSARPRTSPITSRSRRT